MTEQIFHIPKSFFEIRCVTEEIPLDHAAAYRETDYDCVYDEDVIMVSGHSPTGLIDPAFAGRILRRNNHIAIDCGAVFGYPLDCLCLETGESFYV